MAPQFPSVMKIGQAHQGLGKVGDRCSLVRITVSSPLFSLQIKVENSHDYQDLTGMVAMGNCYSTVEPYIDGRCDVYVQKIGQHYKSFM